MIEIYDCTLREGEQAEGASFNFENRLELCKRLDEFGVDYIELGWPLASSDIFDSFASVINVAKKAKIVAFGSTSIRENPCEDENLNSIVKTKVKYACIFGKTWIEHIKKQLRLTEEENLKKIFDSVKFLRDNDIKVFYDAEHYFDGFKKNKDYAIETLISAASAGVETFVLCDTRGGILPNDAYSIVKETSESLKQKGFDVKLGVHFHDDSGLALANTLACLDYVSQVQGTINGIGERLGNLNFSEFLPVYVKKLGNNLSINLKRLKEINELGFKFAGMNIPEKRAFVGDYAFAHKGGVHIDAHSKGASYEHEAPEDFGNKRIIILNTLGGRNSVIYVAEQFGYILDKNNKEVKEKIKKLFEELREYETKGYKSGGLSAEQFLLIEKYFGNKNKDFSFKILEWFINSEMRERKERSFFRVICELDNQLVEDGLYVEGGPIDAAFKTLKKIISKKYPYIEKLSLLDFHVSIALQHREESAVRTMISFSDNGNTENQFTTVGVDKNILGSSIEALEKGFKYYLMKNNKS